MPFLTASRPGSILYYSLRPASPTIALTVKCHPANEKGNAVAFISPAETPDDRKIADSSLHTAISTRR